MFRLALGLVLFTFLSTAVAQDSKAVRDITQYQVDEKTLTDAVASRTLSWLTGSSSNNDYVSVGRTANYFGFVGLRVASGHSLSRSQIAKQTLSVLDSKQRSILISLVEKQKSPFEQVSNSRLAMNRALERLLVGENISEEDFIALGRAYGEDEAKLGEVIAETFGQIIQSLSNEQQQQLMRIREAHLEGKGQQLSLVNGNPKIKLGKEDKKELVNLAARLLSWSTGDEAFNDFEVVGKPSQHFGFVSLRLASNHGIKRGQVSKEVMSLLNEQQRQTLVQSAKSNITDFDDFLKQRAKLMRSLEEAQKGELIDSEKVVEYGREVGKLEARMTWDQAMAMLAVRESLSDEQSQALLALRSKYTLSEEVSAQNSLDRGRQLYAQCALCHLSPSAPSLDSIVGRKVASDSGYSNYSAALVEFSNRQPIWTEALLSVFMASPKKLIPGTYMGYRGLSQAQDRQALIGYLKTLKE
ncbi:membrane c-type cytochrome cy [Vibrio sp. JCM 19236]|nr:membrane c-type cytochrome cy [Vibrio sp. JCM 19236]